MNHVNHGQRGFTLLELMLVMTIIAMLAGAVMLRPLNSDARSLASATAQLHAFLLSVSTEAVRRNEVLGVIFTADSARVLSYSSVDGWQTADGGAEFLGMPHGIRIEKMNSAAPKRAKPASFDRRRSDAISPEIIMTASGESAPFELTLRHVNVLSEHFALRSDGLHIEMVSL